MKSIIFILICFCLLSCSDSEKKDPDVSTPLEIQKKMEPVKEELPAPKSYLQAQKTCPYKGTPIKKEFYHDTSDGKRIYTCCKECLIQVKSQPQITEQLINARGERVLSVKEAEDPLRPNF